MKPGSQKHLKNVDIIQTVELIIIELLFFVVVVVLFFGAEST